MDTITESTGTLMTEFFAALSEHAFLQTAVVAALLASIGCGVMGTYVVVKRIAFIAGGIAHSVLGGMGAAAYYGFDPLHGALLTAIAAALRARGIQPDGLLALLDGFLQPTGVEEEARHPSAELRRQGIEGQRFPQQLKAGLTLLLIYSETGF